MTNKQLFQQIWLGIKHAGDDPKDIMQLSREMAFEHAMKQIGLTPTMRKKIIVNQTTLFIARKILRAKGATKAEAWVGAIVLLRLLEIKQGIDKLNDHWRDDAIDVA